MGQKPTILKHLVHAMDRVSQRTSSKNFAGQIDETLVNFLFYPPLVLKVRSKTGKSYYTQFVLHDFLHENLASGGWS